MFEIDLYLYEDDRTFYETWGVNKQFATREEVEVEARKMLAGPDLYEAAKSALDTLSELIDEQDDTLRKALDEQVLRRLVMAVVKAEGRS